MDTFIKSFGYEPSEESRLKIVQKASTDDFIVICEDYAGRSLDQFFDQWLNYEYYPLYSFTWRKDKNALSRFELSITQEQSGPVYEMPIDVQFCFTGNEDTLITIVNNQREQVYTLELNDVPVTFHFDPQNWILKKTIDKSGGEFSE